MDAINSDRLTYNTLQSGCLNVQKLVIHDYSKNLYRIESYYSRTSCKESGAVVETTKNLQGNPLKRMVEEQYIAHILVKAQPCSEVHDLI